ncbi:MAG TPA: hypothetical protein VH417_01925 [Vicinamibacterales bacterium]|jgi:hypothetical protein
MTFRAFVIAISLAASGVAAAAQDQTAPRSTPLRVQLVISRYQGEKKVSSAPFEFVVNATPQLPGVPEEPSRVRMGVELPVAAGVAAAAPLPNAGGGQTPGQYRAFGTNIDCFAKMLGDGRFKLGLTVEESSPYGNQDTARLTPSPGDNNALRSGPVFRSYRLSNTLVLRDGQSQQFSSATDRFSGEVVKMDVTVAVIK